MDSDGQICFKTTCGPCFRTFSCLKGPRSDALWRKAFAKLRALQPKVKRSNSRISVKRSNDQTISIKRSPFLSVKHRETSIMSISNKGEDKCIKPQEKLLNS